MRRLVAVVLLLVLMGAMVFAQAAGSPSQSGGSSNGVEVVWPKPLPIPLPPIPPIDPLAAQHKNGIWFLPVVDLVRAFQQATTTETVLGVLLVPPEGNHCPLEVKGERAVIYEVKGFRGGPLLLSFQRSGEIGTFRLRTPSGQEVLSKSGRIPLGSGPEIKLVAPEEGHSLAKVRIEICVGFGGWKVCVVIEFGTE